MADGKGLKGTDDVILTVKEGLLPAQSVIFFSGVR